MEKTRVRFNLRTASCGPCLRKTETDVKAASAFCKTCNDFLCFGCIKPHRRLVAMENHQLVNRDHVIDDPTIHDSSSNSWDEILDKHKAMIADEIAKLNPDVIEKYEDFRKRIALPSMKKDTYNEDIVLPSTYIFTELCFDHQDEFIKYYCNNHNKLCCEICKIIDHRHCLSKIKFIPDIVAESDGQYKKDPFNRINEQITEFKEYDTNLQSDIRELKRSKEAFLRDIHVQKREILNWLNCMEVSAVKRLESVFERCKHDLETKRKTAKESREALKAESYFLTEIITNDNTNNVLKFIKAKRAEHVVGKCASKRGHRKGTNTRFSMNINADFQKLKDEITQLYELKFEINGEDKYSVRFRDDKFVSNVTGCTFLANGNIVLADNNNSKIKQFSPSFSQLSNIIITDGVFDTCTVSPHAVVASSPFASNLHIIEIQSEIKVAKTIHVGPGQCWGVKHHDGVFIVNMTSDRSMGIHVVDLNGQVLFNIDALVNYYSALQIGCTENIQPNSRRNVVTVTSFVEGYTADIGCYVEEKSNSEHSMTLRQYNYLHHLHTKGVELDGHDNVVVCCPDVDHIYTISKTGDEAELLLADSDGLSKPQSLTYNKDKTTLLVASENTNFVQLFKFDNPGYN